MTDDPSAEALVALAHALVDGAEPPRALELPPTERWTRGDDGHFRREFARKFMAVAPDGYEDQPPYADAVAAIKADPDTGPLVDGMVGTELSSRTFRASAVIDTVVLGTIVDSDGQLRVDESAILAALSMTRRYLTSGLLEAVVVVPLSGVELTSYPIRIDDDLVLDQMTDDELTACVGLGIVETGIPSTAGIVFSPFSHCARARLTLQPSRSPVGAGGDGGPLVATDGLGIRRHHFGDRSVHNLDEILNDVLFALRLARPDPVASAGIVLLESGIWGTSKRWLARHTRQVHDHGYLVDLETADRIRDIWRMLSGGAQLPPIAVRRFTAATDRLSIEDAIVDHVITAEALLLNDIATDRAELGFRLALRGAHCLEQNGWARRDAFKFLKAAYDLRSRIAHGGVLPANVKVPGRAELPQREFVDVLGGAMRQLLHFALHEDKPGAPFGTTEYWDQLLLGNPAQVE